jgi:hypothetical protein
MNESLVTLVWVYLPEIDQLNSHAAQLQLSNRLAIVKCDQAAVIRT